VALAGVGLVYGIVYLTEGAYGAGGSRLGWAGLFGVSAFLLWRRGGWRCAGVAFGLLILGLVVLYIVLVELHSGGEWPFSV
jgi:hypothetical protein